MLKRLLFASIALVALTASTFAADLPPGTRIPMRITEDIHSSSDEVPYVVTKDVVDKNGAVLLPVGTTGHGHVVQYRSPAMWGGPGKTELSLDQLVLANGTTITISAKTTHYGTDMRVVSVLFDGLAWGWFAKGGSGKVGHHTTVTFVTQ